MPLFVYLLRLNGLSKPAFHNKTTQFGPQSFAPLRKPTANRLSDMLPL